MTGKLILVGASGAMGVATHSVAHQRGFNVLPTYRSRPIAQGVRFNLEVDSAEILEIKAEDTLILLAASSDQAWVRANPREARAVNVDATARLAREAIRRDAWVIFISSEAVFGHANPGGWTENGQPCPATEYGRQKREIEVILQEMGGATIVRTGWNVSGRLTDKCVVKNTYESLLKGTARLADDNVFSLTDVCDTARLLVQLVPERHIGVVHSVSGVPITRTQLADEIIRSSAIGSAMRLNFLRHRGHRVTMRARQ